jgi:hypothetical protein
MSGLVVKYLGVGRCAGRVGDGEVLASWSDFKEDSVHVEMFEAWLKDLIGNGDVLATLKRKPNARFHKTVKIDSNSSTDDDRVELHWIGKGTEPVYVNQLDSNVELMFYMVLPSNFDRVAQVTVDDLLQYFRSSARAAGQTSPSALKQALPHVAAYAGRSKLHATQTQITAVTDLMQQNLQKVIERQEKLEVLVEKSAELETDAENFKRKAHAVERHYCCKKYKIMFIAFLVTAIILIVIITPLAISIKNTQT